MALSKPKTLNFVTGNRSKLAEAQAILGDSIELTSQAIDIPEIQGSLEEIARDKCKKAADAIGGPVLVEDSGLELNALDGLPGPYIISTYLVFHYTRRHFYSSLGNDGLYNLLAAYPDKSARTACIYAYSAGPGSEPILFHGYTDGVIVPKRGSGGFAFDPIFEYQGRTYAEMSFEEKNKVSERFKALQKLKAWLRGDEYQSETQDN
ncbi:TPA_exp: putative Ham1 family pyrophosphatase [Trichophyton benhamiae CBS 112371]|uniref:XTP/dITP diphosphatase n=1 Tax=Arthroderma benhamiae (strain ATCC MYA-4681 / CBS 112371) TaxID=663331 RepID=D4B5B2_ARTBC|nr:Ham1 family pyrophosphatase, putative [Trichophyton benhamiae CBS 112371]EFE29506.1 Ham1 family pyrophosphatase, putative [Trichophyton benhamiae CBS 112371]DAA72781.1 TPA_exp: putative Ham1 family pyrophosphatase [Trichophyton benhamiae CBS 112371]